MDEQEFFNKIKELQKQRDLLKKDVYFYIKLYSKDMG